MRIINSDYRTSVELISPDCFMPKFAMRVKLLLMIFCFKYLCSIDPRLKQNSKKLKSLRQQLLQLIKLIYICAG